MGQSAKVRVSVVELRAREKWMRYGGKRAGLGEREGRRDEEREREIGRETAMGEESELGVE